MMKRWIFIALCMGLILTSCSNAKLDEERLIETIEQDTRNVAEEIHTGNNASVQTENKAVIQETQIETTSSQITGIEATKVNVKKLTSKRKTSYDHFNTICYAVVFDDFTTASALARFDKAWKEINGMLEKLESKASVNIVDSDIYKFNAAKFGERIAISPVTAEIIAKAIEMYDFTEGAYNPAVSNLVDLWGFSPRFLNSEEKTMPYDRPRNENGSFNLPDQRYIEAFRMLSDFSGVKLTQDNSGSYFLEKNVRDIEVDGIVYSLKIDLGGIAKGYGADKAAEILRENGYEYGFVNLGLSSMKLLKRSVSDMGAPSDNMWSIYISNPDNPSENYMTGFGKDCGVSTSGTYELKYFVDGRAYSHIIDPTTGEPTKSDVASASVWGGEASDADALTTALCVMGKEKAIAFINNHLKDYKVALIVRNGNKLELVTNMDAEEYLSYNE